jgi:mxaJ protein
MCLHSHKRRVVENVTRRCVWVVGGLCLLLFGAMAFGSETQPLLQRQLRVCADPNNLPFSNERLEGFENKLAELIAHELNATLTYTWWAQRRGFIRNTLKAATCDLLMGVPKRLDAVLTTSPYYRSTYVFVYRQQDGPPVRSLDDPILRTVKIGVQLIGDDGANSPPAHALARRHMIENVVGYSVYGDYAQPNPTARIIEAVATGAVDVAVVWGPIAGYFARSQPVPLAIVPVIPSRDKPALPFTFDIALGVRRGEEEFRAALDAILQRRRPEINRLLDEYGVPRVETSEPRSAAQ